MPTEIEEAEISECLGGDPATELSSNRTSLSFERTRMSADRTLMSTVRTSLSLISFGFTIHEVFSRASNLVPGVDQSGRRLGLALLVLGVLLLVMGIVSHSLFVRALSERRERLFRLHLVRRAIHYHATPTYVTAVSLLVLGLMAIADVALKLF
jgi:inner membrane protein YidH